MKRFLQSFHNTNYRPYFEKKVHTLDFVKIFCQPNEKSLAHLLHRTEAHRQIEVHHWDVFKKIFLNQISFMLLAQRHPRLFHRPNFPVVLPLPLEDLLDLPSGGVPRTAAPRLPIRRIRLMDDLLFDLFLALQHPVISLCRGDAPGVDIRVKLYVLGIFDGHFFTCFRGNFLRYSKLAFIVSPVRHR